MKYSFRFCCCAVRARLRRRSTTNPITPLHPTRRSGCPNWRASSLLFYRAVQQADDLWAEVFGIPLFGCFVSPAGRRLCLVARFAGRCGGVVALSDSRFGGCRPRRGMSPVHVRRSGGFRSVPVRRRCRSPNTIRCRAGRWPCVRRPATIAPVPKARWRSNCPADGTWP